MQDRTKHWSWRMFLSPRQAGARVLATASRSMDRVRSLGADEVPSALREAEAGHTQGKVVIRL